MYNIQRSGDQFRVGNDQVGYKTFRLKLERNGQEVNLDSKIVNDIANRIFEILKNSNISFKTLANTRVTELGIQTDQQDSGQPYLARKEALSEFEETYKEITKIAAEALAEHLNDKEMRSNKMKGSKKGMNEAILSQPLDTGPKFEKRRVPLFLMKIYEMFEKLFTPHLFNKRHEAYAKSLVAKSPSKIEALKKFTMNEALASPETTDFGEVGSKFAYVPFEFLKTQEEEDAELRDIAITADTAVTSGFKMYKEVPNFVSGGTQVVGYKIHSLAEGGEVVVQGQVTPTAFLATKKKEKKRDRLANIYMTADGTSRILRTGVINTKEKAKAFLTAARELDDLNGLDPPTQERPLRIISGQLNSPENESKLVKFQHMHLSALDHKTKDVEIAHINTPCQRFYDYHMMLEKRGIHLLKGEEKSRHQNIEGMTRYLIWIFEDLERLSNDPFLEQEQRDAFKLTVQALERGQRKEIQKMKAAIASISACNVELVRLDEEIQKKSQERDLIPLFQRGTINEEIKKLQKKQVEQLQTIEVIRSILVASDGSKGGVGALQKIYSILMDDVEGGFLAGPDPVIEEVRNTVMLYRKLLGNQYLRSTVDQSELMERGQELIMFQALNTSLGVISALNCKSGLDRTGFVFALALALKKFDPEMQRALALNWDALTRELNQKMRELDYDTNKLYEWLDQPGDEERKRLYRATLDCRLEVCRHLLKVSLPITAISTGLIGLKWGKGLSENLIPLNFIPPIIQVVGKDGQMREAQIISYNESGKVEGLTEAGHLFLTQLSQRRGT